MDFLGLEFCWVQDCLELDERSLSVWLEVDKFFEVNEDPVVVEAVSIGNEGVGELGVGVDFRVFFFIPFIVELGFAESDKHAVLVFEGIIALNAFLLD